MTQEYRTIMDLYLDVVYDCNMPIVMLVEFLKTERAKYELELREL